MKTNSTKTMSMVPQESFGDHEPQVRRRAYELYEQRGRAAGSELQDWLQAESEIIANVREGIAA